MQTIAIALIGTWLIALGIDLMLNTNRGASLGLRKLLDENSLHQEVCLSVCYTSTVLSLTKVQVLRNYAPALSTKLIFGLSVGLNATSTMWSISSHMEQFIVDFRHWFRTSTIAPA